MKKRYGLLFIALALSACATSQRVTTLSPVAPEGHMEMGREYITLRNDEIQVELGFDGLCKENMVFDAVVINNSGDLLSYNPSDFYYMLLDSANADSSRLPPRMAVHPEKILYQYDETLAANSIEKGINTFIGIMETGIGLVTNASAFMATENPGHIVEAVFNTVGTASYYVAQDQQINHEMEEISFEKEVIQEEILRTGQIPPGKVANGFVFFPRHTEHGYLMFCFPLEDQLFQFVYHQHQDPTH